MVAPSMRWGLGGLLLIGALCLAPASRGAETAPPSDTHPSSSAPPAREPAPVRTHHVIQIDGREFPYTAAAGMLPVVLKDGAARAKLFYTAYAAEGTDKNSRSITFVFNGGPGASSAYLHLAALGPKRVVFNPDGTLPPPPAGLVDNRLTWLAFTDLVFIDPVGTGYSRVEESKENNRARGQFWGVRQDAESLASAIRLYLTRNGRWPSAKFVAGESYGGFRAAALAELLPRNYGIDLNGVIMISPVLEFRLLDGDDYSLLPWVLTVPSYTACAITQGKALRETGTAAADPLKERLKDAESFSLGPLLTELARGVNGSGSEADAVYGQLARDTGLPVDQIRRLRGRIPREVFVKKLLEGSRRIVSIYDCSVAGIDPDPDRPAFKGHDEILDGVTSRITSAFNAYVRDDLGYKTDLPYEVLNRKVSAEWKWIPERAPSQGFAGVADNLKAGMSLNKNLKAFIGHGYYDLATPYFGSVFITDHMDLDPSVRPNLVLKVYQGGHMFYTHSDALKRWYRDIKEFYRSAAPQEG